MRKLKSLGISDKMWCSETQAKKWKKKGNYKQAAKLSHADEQAGT